MNKRECIKESKIERDDSTGCYRVKVAPKDKWIGSPTNTLTSFKVHAACISDREEADRLLEIHCDPDKRKQYHLY